jgi:hypothetical protein
MALRCCTGTQNYPSHPLQFIKHIKVGKAIPVAGREDLYNCEILRIPHWLENCLTDRDKADSLAHQPPLYSPETLLFYFWYTFLLETE